MERNRIGTTGDEAAGSIEEAIGMITGRGPKRADDKTEKAIELVRSGGDRAEHGLRTVPKR